MLAFPGCKINLGLSVINKRSDGYHNLETIFYPLAVHDALEIIAAVPTLNLTTPQQAGHASLTTTGLVIQGPPESNLCLKAYQLLQQDFPHLPTQTMHLHKMIPMGAGLGGGSADGAYTLMVLNQLNNLGLSKDQLNEYSLQLGSDCPFFISNTPCYATGRGEIMEPLPIDLSAYRIVLVNPGIVVPTGWAFANLDIARPAIAPDMRAIVKEEVYAWKDRLTNDFEMPVFSRYPAIKAVKEELYKLGALYAAMTGTGSTVFGIFEPSQLINLSFHPSYRVIRIDPMPSAR